MVICVDFDGTCVTHEFPKVGKDIGAARVLKELVEKGHKLILFTMRSSRKIGCKDADQIRSEIVEFESDVLLDAVNWFKENDIPLYGINTNPDQSNWTSSPKAHGQLYIDDAALGCPLIYEEKISDRPFVDWVRVEEILIEKRLLTNERNHNTIFRLEHFV